MVVPRFWIHLQQFLVPLKCYPWLYQFLIVQVFPVLTWYCVDVRSHVNQCFSCHALCSNSHIYIWSWKRCLWCQFTRDLANLYLLLPLFLSFKLCNSQLFFLDCFFFLFCFLQLTLLWIIQCLKHFICQWFVISLQSTPINSISHWFTVKRG